MKVAKYGVSSLLFLLSMTASLRATATNLFWTTCTTDVLETGMGRIDIDGFTAISRKKGKFSSASADGGITFGLCTLRDFKFEIGLGFLGEPQNSFIFNGKVGIDEEKLFTYCPSFSLGLFGVGQKKTYNVTSFVIGKTLPDPIGTRLFVGVFRGARSLGKHREGWMVGISQGFYQAKDKNGKPFDRLRLVADYSSGKNAIGGGGIGAVYFFSPLFSVGTGPVYFNRRTNGTHWKWMAQVDFGFSCFSPSETIQKQK